MKSKIFRAVFQRVPAWLFFTPLLSLASCSSSYVGDSTPLPAIAGARKAQSENNDDTPATGRRLRIHKASQSVEVSDVAASIKEAEEHIRARNGFVESSSLTRNGEAHASLTIRVPAAEFNATLDEFAALGKETHRRTSAEDTTDAYTDLEARIKNTGTLRDRLRRLLDSTETISEILEIEKELARVQSELDAMRARFDRMQSEVRLSKIELRLETPGIPGPVGAAGKGLWWSFKKLFVLKPGSS